MASVKGGTGKTTTSFALLAAAAEKGMDVIGLDMDFSCALSHALGSDPDAPTLADALSGKADIEECLRMSRVGAGFISGDESLRHTGFPNEALENIFSHLVSIADLVVVDTRATDRHLIQVLGLSDTVVVPVLLDSINLKVAAQALRLIDENGALVHVGGLLASNVEVPLRKEAYNSARELSKYEVGYDNLLYHSAAWINAMAGGGKLQVKQKKQAADLLEEVLSKRTDESKLRSYYAAMGQLGRGWDE